MWRFHLLSLCCGWPWDWAPSPAVEENLTAAKEETMEWHGAESGNGTTVEWWLFKAAFAAFWESGGISITGAHSCEWFGVPGCPGKLRSEGGWIGYFMDGVGVQAFGEWWPWVAICAGVVFSVLVTGLLAYSLHTLLAPVRWLARSLSRIGQMLGCIRRGTSDASTTPTPRVLDDVEWHGPATGWPTETRYLQYRLKGRGSRRRLNDILIKKGGQVARLYQEESMLKRIDSNGLRVKFSNIAGATSRHFRRELENVGEVHLCRQRECREEHPMHVLEFAGVDHDAIIDLHRYAHGSPRWLFGVLWRSISFGLGLSFKVLRCCLRRCCRGQEDHRKWWECESAWPRFGIRGGVWRGNVSGHQDWADHWGRHEASSSRWLQWYGHQWGDHSTRRGCRGFWCASPTSRAECEGSPLRPP